MSILIRDTRLMHEEPKRKQLWGRRLRERHAAEMRERSTTRRMREAALAAWARRKAQ